jgi:hypothetical protein
MRHRDTPSLPVGKLPPHLLARLLAAAPLDDPRVLLGPGVGLDCAVIDLGKRLLVCKFESSPDSKGAKQWSAPSLRGRDQPESSPTDGGLPDGDG